MKNPFTSIGILVTGYIAGTVVWSLFSKNKGTTTQKHIAESENKFETVLDNFIAMHKSMFQQVAEELSKEENKELYQKYKKQVMEVFDSYTASGQKILKDLKEKGTDYTSEAIESLQKLYESKKDNIEEFTDLGKEKIKELQKQLKKLYTETEKEIEEVSEKDNK